MGALRIGTDGLSEGQYTLHLPMSGVAVRSSSNDNSRPMMDPRSDTVTRPTEAMLRAMMTAETGDDVYAEDPTVNRLQATLADRFGHEAGLFCPSGTMANQIAINVHTSPGDEVIATGSATSTTTRVAALPATAGPACALWCPGSDARRRDSGGGQSGGQPLCADRARLCGGHRQQRRRRRAGPGGVECRFSGLPRLGLPFHLDGARAWNALRATGED